MTLIHPPLIHWARDAANGMRPAVRLYGQTVNAENYLTRRQKKQWLSRSWPLGVNTGGTSGTVDLVRFRRRSSIGVSRLHVTFQIGRTLATGVPNPLAIDPHINLIVTPSGGAALPTVSARNPFIPSSVTDAPSEWIVVQKEIEIAEKTTYECLIQTVDYGRLVNVCVRELGTPTISETTDYYNAFTATVDAELTDALRERMARGLSEMYRWNAGGGWDWAKDDGSAATRTSATYANLYDASTTGTPTGATRGFHIDNTYRRTASKTTVPYEIAVYGNMSSAATGNVKLMDTAGNSYGPVAITATSAQWTVGTVDLPADARKYDLQFAGSGAVQLNVRAVSIAEWDALT